MRSQEEVARSARSVMVDSRIADRLTNLSRLGEHRALRPSSMERDWDSGAIEESSTQGLTISVSFDIETATSTVDAAEACDHHLSSRAQRRSETCVRRL